LWRHLRAVVATLGDKARDFVAKSQFIEFLVIFFYDFFSCVITCAAVATQTIFAALATRQFQKKKQNKSRITIASKKSLV